ncbi:metal ABC transporter solute-binding protein, Zn/Mn family [Haloarchaeobius sp. HME9146]|uniref:metal ABC transporter substrate-binding protein n=1 Tax=Haloarchaeobius sp. HME9146 TaxID=2978732 RepID=UPI0021BFC377|nr:zinc ABC transporter substrate-binding protein [Haloarchaeobius sp. HME9146]MCT9097515.1 zinc ABC transporter substrate-binding protein [Haloarchaeobius sp. HME9146]
MERTTRRSVLLGSAATTAALAGCLGSITTGSEGGEGETTVQTSFFVVSDFASAVAGDDLAVNNLIPFGQHGHGWEPGPDVQRKVHGADGFVYVGEGFQPWADKLVRNVRDDGADVHVIEAWEGIDLLPADGGHEEEHHDESGHDDEHHEEEEHDDHGAVDPHFWLDSDRATRAVRTIADGLASVDPDNEAAYAENADAFTDRLAAMDATFEERLTDRTTDTVLVAGHNSFQYLGNRYDFHVEALTGIAPDATPTPKDITRAQAVIDEHDIEYLLAPVFESDRAATQLVAETDATEVLPLTPVPSLTDEWHERGWGYVDVMENVNLPSLATALGAE